MLPRADDQSRSSVLRSFKVQAFAAVVDFTAELVTAEELNEVMLIPSSTPGLTLSARQTPFFQIDGITKTWGLSLWDHCNGLKKSMDPETKQLFQFLWRGIANLHCRASSPMEGNSGLRSTRARSSTDAATGRGSG